MKEYKTKVVVAGAGPVGAVAAYLLAQQGIEVVLAEAQEDCGLDLRASTFHPPTLEMLEPFGITEKLIEMGLKAPIYHFRERQSGEVIDFDLSEIADLTRYPFRVQCEQYHLSRMLSEAVRNSDGAEVLFNHRVVGFEQDFDGVDVFVESPTEIVKIRAQFLIGADGSNSMVRKWLGTGFEGFTYLERFLCYTSKVPLEERLENLSYVNYVSDPEEWMVLLRVPSLWRILVPARDELSDEALLGDDKKNEVFDRLLGDGEAVKTVHRTVYRVHQRVAKSFADRRVSIIGDAAHLNNPIGGFGMNSGIHDAFNLCERLDGIFNHGLDANDALGLFDRQRRKTTHDFIQAQTIKNMEYLSDGQGKLHEKRKADLMATKEDEAKRRQFLRKQAMIECLEAEKAIA